MRYRVTGWMWWAPVVKVLLRVLGWALGLLFVSLVAALLLVALFAKMGY